ncbi:MAG TPA: phosphoadenylyl-sulfate reductase [Bryobacteraceae bacterium]|jgi:phosphoadenosine phosphosulfate reductase|nr:phosphoadenylyl-sulfate reductase [Bryobacteraceae bacterium]
MNDLQPRNHLDTKIDAARQLITAELAKNRAACITSSFQAECVVLVHMLKEQRPHIPVLFLETGYHFPETLQYRDQMTRDWNLNLVNLEAKQSVKEQEALFGILNQTEPSKCCGLRKVEPLFAGLAHYDTWFTALRREQSPTRANLQEVEPFKLPVGKTLEKVSPLAAWTNKDVWQYLSKYGIPALSLYDQGYTSIGCQPCTVLPFDPNNPRSGRWQGKQKLECGIHIQAE